MQARTALAEAQRRWGMTAGVERLKCRLYTEGKDAGRCSAWFDRHKNCPGGKPVCKVGRIELGMFFSIRGTGDTFEAAFQDADNREARDRSRFCRSKKGHGRKRRCRLCKYRGPAQREGLAELQPDGTLLTTDERVAAWQRECDEVRARRAMEKAAVEERRRARAGFERLAAEADQRISEDAAAELERRQQAEAKMMTGREPTAADVAAVEGES